MLARGMGLWRGATRRGWDADALAYIAQVETADGAPLEPKVRLAVNRLVGQCKRDASPVAGVSNWEAMKATCLLAGPRTLAGALVPLRGPAPTNINFVSGDYHPVNGLKGNGSSKYLISNFDTIEGSRQVHMAVHTRSSFEAINSSALIGAGASSTPGSMLLFINNPSFDPRSIIVKIATWDNVPILYYQPESSGFMGASRASQTDTDIQWAFGNEEGVDFGKTHQSPALIPYHVFARNGVNISNIPMTYYSIGEPVDLIAMRSAVDAYMEAIA